MKRNPISTSKALCWILLTTALCGACAGVDVEPIHSESSDEEARGFRYYEESPYILVYSDGGAGLTSKLVYLPDQTRKMSIRPYQYLASNSTNLSFARGVLKKSTVKADATVLPKALVAAAKSAALAAAKAAFDDPTREESAGFLIPVPKLYKVVVDGERTRLIGSSTVGPGGDPVEIRVDLPKMP